MKTRIIVGLLGLPLVLFVIFAGSLPLILFTFIVSLIGLNEFFNAFKIQKWLKDIVMIALMIYYLFTFGISSTGNGELAINFIMFITMFISIMLVMLVLKYSKVLFRDICIAIVGFFYIGFTFSLIPLVRDIENGLFYILILFFACFSMDTFAYFGGKAFGKHKLAPKLSPKKTIEGFISGAIGAFVVCAIFGYIFIQNGFTGELTAITFGICGIIIGVISVFGDLIASAIKRERKIKDFSQFLPGHGGILDRFDSVLFATPVVFVLVLLGA